jgi:HD-like signal output (HDOD) protein
MKALEIINAEDLEFSALETALSADPMLTGIILKYANSPMYSKLVEVNNVRKAINLLGLDIVKSAIVICTMRSYCQPSSPAKELLWAKSIQFALLSKLLARKKFKKLAEGIELAAMMSQIGGLVLSTNYAEDYAIVIEQAEKQQTTIEEQEFELFGLHRADVTDFAMQKLRLPKTIVKSLNAFYLDDIPPVIKTDIDRYVAVLKLSALLISNEEIYQQLDAFIALSALLKLNETTVKDILEVYNEQINEGFSF